MGHLELQVSHAPAVSMAIHIDNLFTVSWLMLIALAAVNRYLVTKDAPLTHLPDRFGFP